MGYRRNRPPDTTKPRYVYFAHDGKPQELVKIGLSVHPWWRVTKEIKCQLLFAVRCEYWFASRLEQALHEQFADLRQPPRRGEGGTEWFAVDERISKLIYVVRRTRRWPWDNSKVLL